MRRRDFQRLVESLPTLSPHQLRQLNESVHELARQTEVRALVAEEASRSARCPHCSGDKLQRWGTTAAGEQRYRCKSCTKSFTGLTGTPLNRVRHKGLLLQYAACMKEGMSVRDTADVLGMHRNVVFRWRHRLMPQLDKHQPDALEGVAEVDEAFFRESFKGQKRGMPRKPHKRATPAGKRGISREQIPVLTAVSRGSRASYMSVLPGVPSTTSVVAALAPVMSKDLVLWHTAQFIQVLPVIAAMATILINVAALRRSRRVPPILLAVIGGMGITWLVAGLMGAQPATVQALPGALPPISMPDLRQVPLLVLPALVMMLLAVTEAMAIAKAVARRTNEPSTATRNWWARGCPT